MGGADAVLVIDDTALPKKGKHSVGVAPQYATVLGKQANCQTLVSLTLARREVPVPLALRLYLPEVWTEDPARLETGYEIGVPLFITSGEKVKVDTRSGEYLGRVNS